MSVGKMHTPVNEWNDAYHHGRLFFPTIDRPYSFGEFVPIHEVGLRLSGENLGAKRAFYDVVLGSGQSAGDDVFPSGVQILTLGRLCWCAYQTPQKQGPRRRPRTVLSSD